MAQRRTYTATATVIGRTKLGETDLILTLLTTEGELMQAVAKGARKPTGKLAGKVQLFSACDFLVAKGRSLDVVAEAGLVSAHAGLRGDLDRVSAASAVCEVARLCSFEDARDPFLSQILERALTACEEAADQPHLDLVVAAFAFKVLARGGWRPQLDGCCFCDDEAPTRFSAASGGLLCESCSSRIEGAEPVDASQIAWLRALLGLTFDELLAAPVEDASAVWLLGCAHVWAATHLDARLKAMEFCVSGVA